MIVFDIIDINCITSYKTDFEEVYTRPTYNPFIASIQTHGFLDPLLGLYEPGVQLLNTKFKCYIRAGEKRYITAKDLGIKELPVIVHTYDVQKINWKYQRRLHKISEIERMFKSRKAVSRANGLCYFVNIEDIRHPINGTKATLETLSLEFIISEPDALTALKNEISKGLILF